MAPSAASIARALGGHRSGNGYLVRCPAPGHGQGRGDRRPSLLINDGSTRLLVHCFAGCPHRDILDELRRRGLLDDSNVVRLAERLHGRGTTRGVQQRGPSVASLWSSGLPLEGTLAERYLVRHRGLIGPFPDSLRYAPQVALLKPARSYPALMAAVKAPDQSITAVQVTLLRGDGRKASLAHPRMTFGHLDRGAVKLSACNEVLGVAEGIEDALAAMQLTGVPSWSSLGAARLHRVALPTSVRELHVFADADAPGQLAARRASKHFCALGIRVVVRFPPEGAKDWANIVMPDCAWRVA